MSIKEWIRLIYAEKESNMLSWVDNARYLGNEQWHGKSEACKGTFPSDTTQFCGDKDGTKHATLVHNIFQCPI